MSRNFQKPLISIGVPTYNRVTNLKRTLQKILEYNYENIEVIVSENDPKCKLSLEVCREFSSKLSIKFFHQKKNSGWIGNFSFVLKKSKGKYFLWHADDDYYDNNFLDIAVSDLENTTNSVSFQGKSICVYPNKRKFFSQYPLKNSNNLCIQTYIKKIFWINYMLPPIRYLLNQHQNKYSFYVYGLHKSFNLKNSWFDLMPYYSNERDLISSLSMQGELIFNDKVNYYRKINDESTSKTVSFLSAFKKLIIFNINKIDSYEWYKLRRINFFNSFVLAKLIIKNSQFKKNIFLLIFIFINVLLRNIFLAFHELLRDIINQIKI